MIAYGDSPAHLDVTAQIISKAKALGASSAGIASTSALKQSTSWEIYERSPYNHDYMGGEWPEEARSLLVYCLAHERSDPKLDWWDPLPGGTPGNRRLIKIANQLNNWLQEELGINAKPLPYKIDKGGIFLKDTAVLAGLGFIGKNNLLITPEFGVTVRLRALFLDVELEPTGPLDFNPCERCDMPCMRACPQNAFGGGSYDRSHCVIQMNKDEANGMIIENPNDGELPRRVIKYCRACELSCPIAR